MIVLLDENDYFTGTYANTGSIMGGIKVDSLPDDLSNNKTKAWKYTHRTWVFDEDKYKTILAEIKAEEDRQASIMTNEELTESFNDLSDIIIETSKGDLI